jgi:IclR family acetate operon transcriptional repressor
MAELPIDIDEKGSGPIVSIQRALLIVEKLADSPHGMTLTEIANNFGFNRAMAFKLLATLEQSRMVFRDSVGNFRLTYKISNLGLRRMSHGGLLDQSHTVLQELADTTGELARLALVANNQINWVASMQGRKQALMIDPSPTLRIRLHTHAAGKAWLSTMPFDKAFQLIMEQGIEQVTKFSLTSNADIRKDLAQAAQRGFAISYEENAVGIGAVASPIMIEQIDGSTSCIGTVSLGAPVSRMSRSDLEAVAPAVRKCATALAREWPISSPFLRDAVL